MEKLGKCFYCGKPLVKEKLSVHYIFIACPDCKIIQGGYVPTSQCNECGEKWTELREWCPNCGSNDINREE